MKGFNLKLTLVFTLILVLTMVAIVNAQEKYVIPSSITKCNT
jgi:hypothetical protein